MNSHRFISHFEQLCKEAREREEAKHQAYLDSLPPPTPEEQEAINKRRAEWEAKDRAIYALTGDPVEARCGCGTYTGGGRCQTCIYIEQNEAGRHA